MIKKYELVVVGGGLSGMCVAISAARKGIKVALIQNRPVLGGNASSEIRMHICGASNSQKRQNARETGIIEEIQLENKYRNPTESYAVFDSILWEKCYMEKNLDLYLNTHMTDVIIEQGKIVSIKAIQLTSEKKLQFTGDIFVDATGDATLGKLSGAEYSVGRESKDVYNEDKAPDVSDNYTMGNSLMFKARDVGKPVPFIKPIWANTYNEEHLNRRDHREVTSGYWWIELGGELLNTIDDAEFIRDDLLKAVYGVWDHIKNSDNSHGAENMDLEWVSFLPGKRESRRLLGDYILKQQDCVKGARFKDGVAYGGWAIDVHVVGGLEAQSDDPTEWIHLDDIYEIPYRCLYSKNIENLMLAGRAISCSHMAFASTRVMATCSVVGEAVGIAATMALKANKKPRDMLGSIELVRQQLLKDDCYVASAKNTDPDDFALKAVVTASEQLDGFYANNIISGVARTVDKTSNMWKCQNKKGQWIKLDMQKKVSVKEVRLTFDSNLSQRLTISISAEVMDSHPVGVPKELVKDYDIEFYLNDTVAKTVNVKNNHMRHTICVLDNPVDCDSIIIKPLSTHGEATINLFEVRVY